MKSHEFPMFFHGFSHVFPADPEAAPAAATAHGEWDQRVGHAVTR
jgi:hypothetical protein